MANKQVNFNVEAKEEKLDLALRLGNDKGKRPIDGSPESKKRKRNEKELEDVSTGRSYEDKLALLEHKLEEIEKLVDRRTKELAAKIDYNFIRVSQCIYNQQAQSIECMRGIHSTLHQLTPSLNPKTFSELQPLISKPGIPSSSKPGTPSTKPEVPCSSKKPPRP